MNLRGAANRKRLKGRVRAVLKEALNHRNFFPKNEDLTATPQQARITGPCAGGIGKLGLRTYDIVSGRVSSGWRESSLSASQSLGLAGEFDEEEGEYDG